MLSVVYRRYDGRIKQIYEYIGKPRPFKHLAADYAVWHIPEGFNQFELGHDKVILENGVPIASICSKKSHKTIKAIAIQTGGLWGLPEAEAKPGQETVLIARYKGLGDILMSWFALEEYRQQNPETHITYLTSSAGAALFCGQEDLVDKVLYSKFEHAAAPTKPDLPVKESKWDTVFNVINQVDFGEIAYMRARADNFAMLMGVKIRSEYEEKSERYIPDIPVRQLKVNQEEIAIARKLINWHIDDRIAVLQLNSNGKPRKWLYWNQLAKKLLKAGYKVVYLSTDPEDIKLKIRNVINLACKTNIREYIAILAIAHILVCVDTSALHIGARLNNLKVIPLFGSTGAWAHSKYYQNTYPIQGQATCSPCWDWQLDSCDGEKQSLTCMRRITADMVMDKIRGIDYEYAMRSGILVARPKSELVGILKKWRIPDLL